MTTLMQMREWLFADVRIYEQIESYEKCVNSLTVEVFRSLVDDVKEITEYWLVCEEFDEL